MRKYQEVREGEKCSKRQGYIVHPPSLPHTLAIVCEHSSIWIYLETHKATTSARIREQYHILRFICPQLEESN